MPRKHLIWRIRSLKRSCERTAATNRLREVRVRAAGAARAYATVLRILESERRMFVGGGWHET